MQNSQLTFNQIFSKPDSRRTTFKMMSDSQLNVTGDFDIFSGGHIIINKGAKLILGSGYINYDVKIRCFDEITIGHNVAISENVTIWDSDAHQIIGKESEMTKPVKIGNHVWIGTNAIILKGSEIGDGCIVAAGAVVSGKFPNHSLIGGIPAKVIRENVSWK